MPMRFANTRPVKHKFGTFHRVPAGVVPRPEYAQG